MISGNGSTGIMVMGRPLDEKIIINHEKLWVVKAQKRPEIPDLSDLWPKARAMAREGRFRDAFLYQKGETAERCKGVNVAAYDHIHPGLHLHLETAARGRIENYTRRTELDTGEVLVNWTDAGGTWQRRTFVSRTDDVIVMQVIPPAGECFSGSVRLTEAPGKRPREIGSVVIDHTEGELYFKAVYHNTMGKAEAEGYHLLARAIPQGGPGPAIENERISFSGINSLLVIMRLEYLDCASAADRTALGKELSGIESDYDSLLAGHAAVHGEMLNRVTLDLDSAAAAGKSSEDLIRRTEELGPSAEWLEMLHAVGRYALISGGTGLLPVALSGIWGNNWAPEWDGRYTFDANINLAVAGCSQGNLPEVMETFFGYVENSFPDWEANARKLYGCGGVLADLCQGWRHGLAVIGVNYRWTGGAGWLANYFHDHYLYTRDKTFLADRVVPLLKEVAAFYRDFLEGTEDENGKVVFYPSVSPENSPITDIPEQSCWVVPNSTCEIAICREVLTNLIAACRELDIEKESIPQWEGLLERLPQYRINEDGALAEWSHPGLGDNYNHRHSSHLYPLYPSLEITEGKEPELFQACRAAVDKRLEAGLGHKTAHGFLHVAFVAIRLKDPKLLWRTLTDLARLRFFNSSMISCHNPGLMIYNFDATFALPGVITEMLVYSEPGLLELLPALPQDKLPSGTLCGLLGRGGITVEMLHWNVKTARVILQLRSDTRQKVRLKSSLRCRQIKPLNDAAEGIEITHDKDGHCVELPANKSVRLQLVM